MPTDFAVRNDEPTIAIKTPPHSIEAEQSVLGGLMLDNQALDHVLDKITPSDFYRIGHRHIFNAIVLLSNESKPFDPLTISELLEIRGD